jgi:hypothetical protein
LSIIVISNEDVTNTLAACKPAKPAPTIIILFKTNLAW